MLNPASLPVPAKVAERARDLAAGRVRPADPRPAATVVLLRDSDAGPQLYLIRRRASMAFAAGMYAFPGGRVDGEEDIRTAALRELFEETSVLLAGYPPAGDLANQPASDPVSDLANGQANDSAGDELLGETSALESDRLAIVRRSLGFEQALRRHGLLARPDLLLPCAHWITPEAEERRYDTWFYLAAMPPGQRARDVSGEADRAGWWSPGEVEQALAAGTVRMMPPTVATVTSLAAYRTVADVFDDLTGREIPTIRPTVEFDEAGEPYWRLG